MIIDFHTHVFPDQIAKKVIERLANKSDLKPTFDGTKNELIKLMDIAHVDKSIILPIVTNPLRTVSINDYSIMENKRNNRVLYFGSIHPLYNDIEAEVIRLKENGIKGIKIHPEYQDMPIDDERMIYLIDTAFKYNLIVTTHAGFDCAYKDRDYASVKRIKNMLSKLKNKGILILAHLGGLDEWEDVYNLLAGEDVYFDTALTFYDEKYKSDCLYPIKKELLVSIIKKHGDDKILFGSDNPWMNPKYMIEYLNNLNLSDETKDKILYKNALKILGE